MLPFVVTLLIIAVVALVVYPLVIKERETAESIALNDDCQQMMVNNEIAQSIVDGAAVDYEMGNMSKETYTELKSKYAQQPVPSSRSNINHPQSQTKQSKKKLESEIEQQIRKLRQGTSTPKDTSPNVQKGKLGNTFCSQCGAKCNPSAKFCYQCGAKISGGESR